MSDHRPASHLVISESMLVGEGLSAFETYSIVLGLRTVKHRYSDFEWLRSALIDAVPSSIIPPLPPKTYLRPAVTAYFYTDEDFMEARRRGLEEFLVDVMEHPKLRDCECLKVFLSGNDQQFQAAKSQNAGESTAWRGKIAAFGMSIGKSLSSAISKPSFPLKQESDRKFETFFADLTCYKQNSEDLLTHVNTLISHCSGYSQSLFDSGQVLDSITRSSSDRELAVLTAALVNCGIEVGQACIEQSTKLKCVLKFRLETMIRSLDAGLEAIQRREKECERLAEEYAALGDKKMRMIRDKYMEMDVRQQEERLERVKGDLEDFSRDLEEEIRAFVRKVQSETRKVVADMAEIHIQYYEQTAGKWGQVKQVSL